jgi:beta-glucanase (GH16 family)
MGEVVLIGVILTAKATPLGDEFEGTIATSTPIPTATETATTMPTPEVIILPAPAPTPTPETPQVTPTSEATINPNVVQAYPNSLFGSESQWSQNFANMPNGTIDSHSWNTYIGPPPANAEAEYYTGGPDNLRIEDGVLILEARQQSAEGFNYTSARIDTQGKKDFLYGKLEITATLPTGVGTWPAIWLFPSEERYKGLPIPPGTNPNYADGEIDIAEVMGIEPNVIYGIGHSLLDPDKSRYPKKYYATIKIPDSSTNFHVYSLEWTPTKLTFGVDGNTFYSVDKRPTYTYTKWPYDQKYYLILNNALGGTVAHGDPSIYPPNGVDNAVLPAKMQIKSVNYFSYVGPAG